jgi:2-hydroxy-3-oxopropionate reductase
MGLPMARNLLETGYPLTVCSRTPARADELVDAGARWADTPAGVASASDVVVTMLPDSPDVVAVVTGDDGVVVGAHDDLVWIDTSSIAPATTRALVAVAAPHGIRCLDAPVSGGEQGAIDATLSIMVGGPRAVFDECLPILTTLGRSVVHVGDAGAGQVTKLCNQAVVGATIAAVAEALTLAERAGVDPVVVREVLLGGFAQSRVLDAHGQRMLDRAFEPGFRAALHRKDLVNALDAARDASSPTPLTAAVEQLLAGLCAAGGSDLDHAALLLVYEELLPTRVTPIDSTAPPDDSVV